MSSLPLGWVCLRWMDGHAPGLSEKMKREDFPGGMWVRIYLSMQGHRFCPGRSCVAVRSGKIPHALE